MIIENCETNGDVKINLFCMIKLDISPNIKRCKTKVSSL